MPLPEYSATELRATDRHSVQEEFVKLARALWTHNFEEAERLSGVLHAHTAHIWGWAARQVEQARRQLRCCELVHEIPHRTSPVIVYALGLCLAALAYASVLWYSALAKQQKFNRLLSGAT